MQLNWDKKLQRLLMTKMKLSVVLAVKNEEENIGPCLESAKKIFADLPAQAGEIIVVDDGSVDKTVEIAKKNGAKVFSFVHKNNFHETKQFAMEKAKGDWVLQLDADERVTEKLANEIKIAIQGRHPEFISESVSKQVRQNKMRLFKRHEELIRQREGSLGKPTGEIVAYFIPRINFFLGGPLVHAGVYPDGVIRLFKKGKARLPAKSVHELMEVDGEVGWLFSNLEHHESPTLKRFLDRANLYTDYTAMEFEKKNFSASFWNLFKYSFIIPILKFLLLYFRHKGFMDGMRGFLWSAFSALHFPIAYFKYWQKKRL